MPEGYGFPDHFILEVANEANFSDKVKLLDGDWASNASSWQCLELAVGRGQWVAGSNANKKYYANQDNINKYFNSSQKQRSSWMRSGLSFALAIYFLCKGKLAC